VESILSRIARAVPKQQAVTGLSGAPFFWNAQRPAGRRIRRVHAVRIKKAHRREVRESRVARYGRPWVVSPMRDVKSLRSGRLRKELRP